MGWKRQNEITGISPVTVSLLRFLDRHGAHEEGWHVIA
jgi:hypothetical protein